MGKEIKTLMNKYNSDEEAATAYASEHGTPGVDYEKVYDAYLAGIEYGRKNKISKKPDKEYYGF